MEQNVRPAPGTNVQIAVAGDPLWYKDAIIYQLHVKAFFDHSDDGVGDFAGLAERLDYLVSLGVTAVWLLPFYPSPLRDDGYDTADYRNVHPSYGTMRDFRRFVRAAHDRGLKVITELVVNHTSDQHPWFQRARRARKGSNARNYYVWSDDDKKWSETRIIFCDTEQSNWTWDPVAEQYYWHRFFSHQPDLNYDNPRVFEEVLRIMKFWLDAGVDGMRLDAIPYLVQRDGTNNENLPETHAVIKRMRAWMDDHYPGRMLLGEANQWPEDVLPYFGEGDGDECNMAFHFPLMPRMYMALAQEERLPITDIMRQTPDIPATAQWAIFLRNHDELTLEMVTDRERDYLWNFYAAEPRARINLGIRRRLAPLVDNDRRKIELLNSMLMSMPGTPIVYYGDEIGMGDNIYLGDRDAVRTPMQWSPDRNGGFSRTDPARLYLPPVQDALYGYHAVNVEAQHRNPSSLLNWMRRLITVRKQHQSFGRGRLRFLYPGNRKVLAYLRIHDGETILCVCNLSRAPQPVELDLAEFDGRVPIELMGRSAFPPIGELPYFVTLPAYGFYWFLLAEEQESPSWHEPHVAPLPEFVTIVMGYDWQNVVAGRGREQLENTALPEFLPNQRWFAAKGRRIARVESAGYVPFGGGRPGDDGMMLAVYRVWSGADKEPQHYFLPLAMAWETRDHDPMHTLHSQAMARVRRGPRTGVLYDATASSPFAVAMTRAILAGREIAGDGVTVRFVPTRAGQAVELPDDVEAARLGKEQSNTSMKVGETLILKALRRLEEGIHPEAEIGRFLTDVAEFGNIPPLYGHGAVTDAEGREIAFAVLQGFVRNQGDGWQWALDYLDRFLEEAELRAPEDLAESHEEGEHAHAWFGTLIRTLGKRTAELHRAFAIETDDPAFAAEPVTDDDMAEWRRQVRWQADAARTALTRARAGLAEAHAAQVDAVLERWDTVNARIDALLGAPPADTVKTRFHGDFHLGQVVLAKDDFYFLDFEGEPVRSLAERRRKHTPLKDVAGMLRSFNYATWAALFRREALRPGALDQVAPWARDWEEHVIAGFMEGYRETIAGAPVWPAADGEAERLIDAFVLEKALYEIAYEAANRPAWIAIPLEGLSRVLGSPTTGGDA